MKPFIGLGGFKFSTQIASKYGVFRDFGRLPVLILLKLASIKAASKKTKTCKSGLVNNYFGFDFNIYLEVIGKMIKTPGNYNQHQKLHVQPLQKINNTLLQRNFYIDKTGSVIHSLKILTAKMINAPLTYKNSVYSLPKSRATQDISFETNAHVPEPNQILYPSSTGFQPQYKEIYPLKPQSIKTLQNRAAKIVLSHTHNVSINNPQKILIIRDASQKSNSAVHPLLSEFQFQNKEVHSLEPQHIKTVGAYQAENNPVFGNNILFHEAYLNIKPAKVVLSRTHNASINNSEKTLIIRDASQKSNSTAHPLSFEFQLQDKKVNSLEPQHIKTAGANHAENNAIYRKTDTQISPQNRAARNISYPASIYNPQKNFIVGNASQKPNSAIHSSSSGFQFWDKEVYSLEPQPIKTVEAHQAENNPTFGNNILFPETYLRTKPANIVLSRTHTASINYLQKTFVIRDTNQKSNSVTHPPPPGFQPQDEEMYSSEPSSIKTMEMIPAVSNSVYKKATVPLLQDNRTVSYPTLKAVKLPDSSAKPVSDSLNQTSRGPISTGINSTRAAPAELRMHNNVSKYIIHLNNTRDEVHPTTKACGLSRRLQQRLHLSLNTGVVKHEEMLKKMKEMPSEMVSPGWNINLQHADLTGKKSKPVGLKDLNGDDVYKPAELVLKKPVAQKTESVPENNVRVEKTETAKTNGNFIKESFKEKKAHEINTIADRVYRIIERKISIEKDRRGLF